MQIPKQALLLRIFIGESNELDGRPLYEAIIVKAREMHLAGATVLRGPMGFGRSSRLHTAKILRLSEDLPLVIEIVDGEDKINEFLPALEEMIESGLVTLEKVQVLRYGDSKKRLIQRSRYRVQGFESAFSSSISRQPQIHRHAERSIGFPWEWQRSSPASHEIVPAN